MNRGYVMPGKRPRLMCSSRNTNPGMHNGRPCSRREGHGGRHAFVLWGMGGIVRAVWGER